MATMVLVTDVPMLAPMMMGTADFTSSTAEVKRHDVRVGGTSVRRRVFVRVCFLFLLTS